MQARAVAERPELKEMVERLGAALGTRLESVVLYGSAARGDFQEGKSDLNLAVVADALDPRVLEALSGPIAWWTKKGQPIPTLLTRAILADSLDVFPIEALDLRAHRVVLRGGDPFADLVVRVEPLRLQCEREFREKLMRLREGYLQAHGSTAALARLLTSSYTTFLALFRGGLHLVGEAPPAAAGAVAAAFCARAGIDPQPFDAVDRLRRGEASPGLDLKTVFSAYYEQLSRAAGVLDAFRPSDAKETR